MRIIELSNHPLELRREGEEQRRAQAATANDRYERDLAAHADELQELVEQRSKARAERRWGRWLRTTLAVGQERKRAPAPPAPPQVDERREGILAAGIEGESQLAIELGAVLDDSWTLIRGYRNRRGEIDGILLGPDGIVAIEVKHWRVVVHVDGEAWWFDRYDRWGNFKGTDYDRRSPSEQLDKPTEALRAFLESRGCHVDILRAVLFTHPRAGLGSWQNLPVNIIATTISGFLAELRGLRTSASPAVLAEVERLIVRDHRHHEQRRAHR